MGRSSGRPRSGGTRSVEDAPSTAVAPAPRPPQPANASGELRRRSRETCEIVEADVAVADLSHDQQRVAIADDRQSVGDRTDAWRRFGFWTHSDSVLRSGFDFQTAEEPLLTRRAMSTTAVNQDSPTAAPDTGSQLTAHRSVEVDGDLVYRRLATSRPTQPSGRVCSTSAATSTTGTRSSSTESPGPRGHCRQPRRRRARPGSSRQRDRYDPRRPGSSTRSASSRSTCSASRSAATSPRSWRCCDRAGDDGSCSPAPHRRATPTPRSDDVYARSGRRGHAEHALHVVFDEAVASKGVEYLSGRRAEQDDAVSDGSSRR